MMKLLRISDNSSTETDGKEVFTYNLENDIEFLCSGGQELRVVEGSDDGLDASDFADFLGLLLRSDKCGDVVLLVLGDELKDGRAHET